MRSGMPALALRPPPAEEVKDAPSTSDGALRVVVARRGVESAQRGRHRAAERLNLIDVMDLQLAAACMPRASTHVPNYQLTFLHARFAHLYQCLHAHCLSKRISRD